MLANGIDLDTLAFNVTGRSGLLQAAPRRGKNVEIPNRHGSILTPGKKHTGASVPLKMWVIGADEDGRVPRDGTMREVFGRNLDKLMRIFGADTVELVDVLPDGSRRRITGQVLDTIGPEVQAGGTRAEFAVSLECPAAFWEDVDPVAASRSGTGVWTVLPFGGSTAPMDDLVVRFTAPATNPRLTNPHGVYVAYNATLTGGQWVELDCATWALSGGGGLSPVWSAVAHGGDSRWFVLEPGSTAPVVTASQTAGSTGGFLIRGRRKYKTG